MSPKLALLGLIPLLATAAAAQSVLEGGRFFYTELTGEAEVNAQGVPNQGDLDGTGFARVVVNPGQQRVCWHIEVQHIATPTRGHIHRAPAGVNGPIVVTFFEGTPDLHNCTKTPLDPHLLNAIVEHPENYYVNIHNAEFPGGALRGQLPK